MHLPQPLQSKPHRYLLAGVLALLSALGWLSQQTYAERELRYQHQIESFIKNTNDQTQHNLMRWRARLKAVADAQTDDRLLGQALAQWFPNPQEPLSEILEARLRTLTERSEFAKVMLLDLQGRVVLATAGMEDAPLSGHEHAALQQAFARSESVLVEPYQQERFAFPTFAVMAPLYDGLEPIAALWMVVDLRATLFPLLNAAQQGRATTESMLLQRDGDSVLHINPLRHRNSAPLDKFAGLHEQNLVAVQAFAGIRGILYGQDYRRHQVLAASSVVPGSPWILVSKIDVDEAFAADQRREGILFGLSIGAMALLVVGGALYWMWRTGLRERALKTELEKNLMWLDRAQKTALIGFFSLDFSAQNIFLSPMAAEILNTQGQQSLPFAALRQYMPEAQIKRHLHQLLEVRRSRSPQKIELQIHTPESGARALECWCEVEDGAQLGQTGKIIGTLQDITQRKVLDQALDDHRSMLERQVRKDSLTGLSNRRALDEELAREWRYALREQQPLAVLVIDIDHFKGYNDRYGHLQGDACLKQVAATLAKHVQRARDQVYRFGGEEFVVLLPQTSLAQAEQVAHYLCAAVKDQGIEHLDSASDQMVTISIGVASLIPQKEHPISTCPLVEMADSALYRAKDAGRNQVCVASPGGPLSANATHR